MKTVKPIIRLFEEKIERLRKAANEAKQNDMSIMFVNQHAAWNEALDLLESQIGRFE